MLITPPRPPPKISPFETSPKISLRSAAAETAAAYATLLRPPAATILIVCAARFCESAELHKLPDLNFARPLLLISQPGNVDNVRLAHQVSGGTHEKSHAKEKGMRASVWKEGTRKRCKIRQKEKKTNQAGIERENDENENDAVYRWNYRSTKFDRQNSNPCNACNQKNDL